MRAFALILASCTRTASPAEPSFDSVRDRLEHGARLYVAAADSSGTITARRLAERGWIAGETALAIASGELVARADNGGAIADGRGAIALDRFAIALAPIEIPDDVFGKPAQLQDVAVELAAPASSDAQWQGNDSATAMLSLVLDVRWAIAIDGGVTPLGTLHLPAIPLTLALSGDGTTVDASLGLAADGELWSWAGLIQLAGLELSLVARTVD